MRNTYSNFDDPIVANERLRSKIDFLQRQSIKRQIYLKDLQVSLKLNQKTINQLTKIIPNFNNALLIISEQNKILHNRLKMEYQNICKMNALYLMQCQLRVEEKKSYNQRISQFQNNMAELRKYLHDKEDSFTFVIEKLKKYQEIGVELLGKKLQNYSAVFLQDTVKQTIKQLSVQKQFYKQKYNDLYQKLQRSQTNARFNERIQAKQQQLNMNMNMIQTRNQPNVQLIRLMKRQKLSNQILQQALNDAIDKNMQLIECNKRLINNNQSIRGQMDYIIADMVLLCNNFIKYDPDYFSTKLFLLKSIKRKSKCDIDLPSYKEIIKKYILNDIDQAQIIVFNRMRNDVNEMGEYIAFCTIQKINNIKSFQCPVKGSNNYANQQQISMNQKQFSINQI